ncbi:hypothetical protein AURDEDRAFT_166994 [Auricularia subglabra TFB-10046 SS5]|nr:hypothetical protein AURDEDRAFT_166994 [Auricularia subglabra TFB-10046 SS5]
MPTHPTSLLQWRKLDRSEPAWTAWQQFEPFFKQHGYRLFVPDPDINRFLPDSLGMKMRQSAFHMQASFC